ncbi:MAG TPA: vWA domain-containing protein [Planctomycetaceae bacterium]|nr:vWA domain-containing protein [Planctomycetaceae bacterium]
MRFRELPGVGISLALHATIAIALAFVHFRTQVADLSLAVESLFEAERTPEEFTKELGADTEVSETLSLISGGGGGIGSVGGMGGSGGSGGPSVSQTKIDTSGTLQDPTVDVGGGDVALPGLDQLGRDLGETQISGETAAVAENYSAALSRITQELLRMMREDKVLVVWLFDESESMKDDQKEIREQFHKVYEELGLAVEKDTRVKRDGDVLLSAIHSFGQSVRSITSKPTADIPEIRTAIDKIDIDPSGKENLFGAVGKVIDQYRSFVTKGRRKLVIIVVTDESGDDGQGPLLDEVIFKAQRARAPVYILGREAVFGYPYARMRWKDPKYGLTHWLVINRGPETPAPEGLQYDGLHERWDSFPSGFAPYEQARLAKETGGIFFVLPHEEENLVGQAAIDRRKFAFLDLKEYIPDLVKRKDYEDQRHKSRFRSTVWDVVKLLDPQVDKELRIQEIWYSTDPARFKESGQVSFQRALRAMGLLNQAASALEKVKPLRDKEQSQRWRANYDLTLAQVLAYRVRLFQFLLAMDAYLVDFPKPPDSQHNVWNIQRTPEMQTPTDRQIKLTKVDTEELRKQLGIAKAQFEFVRKSHPGTPWANRAEFELNQGFGMRWGSTFRDPRYDRVDREIKFPTL